MVGLRAVYEAQRLAREQEARRQAEALNNAKDELLAIVGHELRQQAPHVAVARIEQLYPFPLEAAAALTHAYPSLEQIVWAQEEPQNMGAWRAIRHRLEEAKPDDVPLLYVGRPWRASPSEGYPTAHLREQDRIARAALGV